MKRRIPREVFEKFFKFPHRIDIDIAPDDLLGDVGFLMMHY
jgi:hypothetical protein